MDLRSAARNIAMQEGVDPDLFMRLIEAESSWRPGARSQAGAVGLAQLMPGTAADLGVDPNDPLDNMRGGARYLRQQLDTFGSVPHALAAYNAGPGAVRKYGGIPPYAETQAYVSKITGAAPAQTGGTQMAPNTLQASTMSAPQKNMTFGERLQTPETQEAILAWALGLQGKDTSPMLEMYQRRRDERKEQQATNRTAAWLRANGREDLAAAIESGAMTGRDAANVYYQPADKQGSVVSAADLRKLYPGTQIEDGLYSVKPDGTISKVGGAAGPTINVSTGGGKFEEAFAKGDADTINAVYAGGLAATRNMGRIDELERRLAAAPQGAVGAIKQAAGEWGVNTEGLDDIQAAQALVNALVPEQRQPGSGPMSDADLALFKQSLPRIINQPGGNQTIISTMRAIAQYDAEGAAIVQALRSGEIDRAEAFRRLQSRTNPLANFSAPAAPASAPGAAPTGAPSAPSRRGVYNPATGSVDWQ